MGGKPSIPTDTSRQVEVIGAGFSRTGTVTFSLAMERLLNGPVMHAGTQMLQREDAYVRKIDHVYRVRHDKPKLMAALRDMTAGYVAICDGPVIQFVEELAELYPNAKVICMTRDPVKWWKSIQDIMDKIMPWWLHVLLAPIPGRRWVPGIIAQMGARGPEIMGPVSGPEMMERHIAYVKASVKDKDRLFFLDTKDYGWEPLAKILDKPVPDEPFPRANDTEETERVQRDIILNALSVWMGIFAVLGSSIWLLLRR